MASSERSMLIVTSGWGVPTRELPISFVRSGGPGGQNVNKVSSKAVLCWSVVHNRTVPAAVRKRFLAKYRKLISGDGRLVVSSQRYRSARRNATDCLNKLRAMLLSVAADPKPRVPSRPTRASVARRLDRKQRHARKKRTRRTPPLDQ